MYKPFEEVNDLSASQSGGLLWDHEPPNLESNLSREIAVRLGVIVHVVGRSWRLPGRSNDDGVERPTRYESYAE